MKWTLALEAIGEDEKGYKCVLEHHLYSFPENWSLDQVRELLLEKGFKPKNHTDRP